MSDVAAQLAFFSAFLLKSHYKVEQSSREFSIQFLFWPNCLGYLSKDWFSICICTLKNAYRLMASLIWFGIWVFLMCKNHVSAVDTHTCSLSPHGPERNSRLVKEYFISGLGLEFILLLCTNTLLRWTQARCKMDAHFALVHSRGSWHGHGALRHPASLASGFSNVLRCNTRAQFFQWLLSCLSQKDQESQIHQV